MYHGGSDPRGDLSGERDITPYYDYAKGYADKSGANVWYVDVPEDAPYMKKAFEEFEGGPKSPYINTKAPANVMAGARPAAALTPPAEAAVVEPKFGDVGESRKVTLMDPLHGNQIEMKSDRANKYLRSQYEVLKLLSNCVRGVA
jgi:hypothetical protein